MAKGCCSKPDIEKEEKPKRIESLPIDENAAPVDEQSNRTHNEKLLDYQEYMSNDPNNKSLTKKVLTREMALDNLNIRGFLNEGLGECVYPNVHNLQCLVPYAVTPDCYNTFADFFGEIIEEIHGVCQDEISLYPYFGDVKSHSLIDLNSFDRKRRRVLYTDIIIRRNIQDITFTSKMNTKDRKQVISQIEPKIRNIFENCEELALIPIEWEQRINSIFDELDDCDSMRQYPEDRLMLVFKNDNIFQGCILNFDDHIQYIVSTNDGRIGELMRKMSDLILNKALEDINYTAHSVYGHLTVSPEYIGTGITIRIMAKFPFISRLCDVNSLIKSFDAATKYEFDKNNTGILILYNTKTFNKSENEIFKDLISAFNKLSLIEDELELSTPMSVQKDCMVAEKLESLAKRIKESESKSYTKKFLTDALIRDMQGVKTHFGTTLNNCIRHNAFYPFSLFPRACDSDCYTKFQTFFNPILLQTNNTKSFKHSTAPSYGSAEDKIYRLHHPHIFSYRVRFSRNFNMYPFPIMMSDDDRLAVETIMKKFFDEISVELEGEYIPLESLRTSVYMEEIMKYKFTPSFNEVDAASGLFRNWPKYRGIYFTKRNINYPDILLAILVNFSDHIKVISLDTTGRGLGLCYDRAIGVMKFLDFRLSKVFSNKLGYGYLTTMPNSVGCGMRVSALVFLENLGKLREILERECMTLQFAYRGSFGHGSVASNNVFDISIKINLNVTEKWIILVFAQRLKDLILIERKYDPNIAEPSNEEEPDREIVNESINGKTEKSENAEALNLVEKNNIQTEEAEQNENEKCETN